jgi:hypothetical protein
MAKIVTIEQEMERARMIMALHTNGIIDKGEARDLLVRTPNFEGIGKKSKAKK